ncbi:MAG TPA: hypothetical protein VKD69_02015 [Vicinamibacterales bacterium]|nr:hypothetical protein [Vicinamibacterales bacterium]
MDTTRARFGFAQDQSADQLHPAVIAVVVVLALIVVALAVRELRFAPQVVTTTATAATEVPTEVVSVATLVLDAGQQIHVGDAKPDAIARLASQTLIKRTEEHGPFGPREVRAYTGYTLVFEPLARAGEPRVAAIYVQ